MNNKYFFSISKFILPKIWYYQWKFSFAIFDNSNKEMHYRKMKLETKRLILQEWHINNLIDLIDGLNNLNVSKWLANVPYPYLRENAANWIDYCNEIDKNGNSNSYEFAIKLKQENRVIGGTSITDINTIHKTAGGGIWIHEKYQGVGYGREAFGEKIRFSFEELGLRRLENGFFAGNSNSQKMQEQFGYKIEGLRRKRYLCMADGEYKDETITGLLKEEWIRN